MLNDQYTCPETTSHVFSCASYKQLYRFMGLCDIGDLKEEKGYHPSPERGSNL
jgi:hypothetical protein